MSVEKPKKPLVGWSQYLYIMGTRTTTFLIAITTGTVAIVCLVAATVGIVAGALHFFTPAVRADCVAFGVLLGLIGLRWLPSAKDMYRKARQIQPVVPIIPRNAHLLAAEDTLVRPSDLPPSHQQAELLRAAPQGSETPAEELLRASTHRQEY